ncbi:hypothetical protein IWW55_002293 [Coemansia sp. RSA 2706]|nr:hypothetical protein LPJ63_001819 [Coemansia sp. RSA 2711]KAJ2304726.1 hypothetical protein IWW55_002293 [Coemansia sp. RSA 2706]KAJ2308723.1 hypothetical protein IWW54_003990 [Coemansia sp. RSA 2705]KAJ2316329.1 hypothetical protein IWW52_003703 [Coemansia sp. RSA 2704]KAJ2326896.1 hypothetical protein IWW51_002043 [Coemansia sp. RSA 2702]KAJ2728714.1 hypothetical protein H4R23_003593 [Coemansia sp. Cherry 401B]
MGIDTAPVLDTRIYSASSSPLMPHPHGAGGLQPPAFRTAKSASPVVQPLYPQNGKLPSLSASLASTFGLHMDLVSPREPPSPKLPISPRSSGEGDAAGFRPYYMDIGEAKAPELQQRHSKRRSRSAAPFTLSGGPPTPDADSSSSMSGSLESVLRSDGETSGMRIKRSLTTLLQRSSSMLRRSDSGVRRQNTSAGGRQRRGSRSEEPTPFVRSNSPTPAPETSGQLRLQHGDLAAALTASQFNLSPANTLVSPLISNSMVHVKVIMDRMTAVVVPMVRSTVFARARERILTKFFQGGVPLVETKRRHLALRRPDGSMAAIADNPAWRAVMAVAADAGLQQAHAVVAGAPAPWPAVRPASKTVVKLTLYLTDALEA